MAIHFSAPRTTELKPRIVVFGVGGAGCNAVNNMIDAGLQGVDFVVANTDAQQLAFAKTDKRVQLGVTVTQGLGAGAHPEIGMSAAEESTPEILEHLDGCHMVFITAGMGGGTGTGAAPIIAKCAREKGILTVGVVTKPFHFEGRHRMRLADAGIGELQRYVDTLIVIPNQNLFRLANERTTFAEAFSMADQVLHSGVRSITDLMVQPGLINLDFADVRTVMTEMGKAMMGTGEASGEARAVTAAQNAIQNPLLDEVSLKGAKAVLVNVTGGPDMTLLEVDEACMAISAEVDPDSNTIFGAAFDDSLMGMIRVSVVATGMDGVSIQAIESRPVYASAAHRPPAAVEQPQADPEPADLYLDDDSADEPVEVEAVLQVQPVVAPAAQPAPVEPERVLKIVDPAVEEMDAELDLPLPGAPEASRPRIFARNQPDQADDDPLFIPEQRPAAEQPKSGWMSLFGGRPRYEEEEERIPQFRNKQASPQARTTSSAQPAPEGEQDDLEIPSFLRRLAN